MITSAHSIIYASDADQARAFFRDVLELPYVDVHDGWLIFRLPPGELGIHPESGAQAPSGRHELYLMCDDLDQTIADLTAKGAEFTAPVTEAGSPAYRHQDPRRRRDRALPASAPDGL